MPCRAPRIESTTNRLGVPNSSDAVLRVEGHDGRHRKEFACCVAMLPPLTFLVLLRPSSGKMVVLSDSFFLKAIVFRLTSLPVWPTRSIAQRTSTRYRCRLSLITGPSLKKYRKRHHRSKCQATIRLDLVTRNPSNVIGCLHRADEPLLLRAPSCGTIEEPEPIGPS